ncbi:hypothetical protein N2152v2_006544 [Parachlorella kessleri]
MSKPTALPIRRQPAASRSHCFQIPVGHVCAPLISRPANALSSPFAGRQARAARCCRNRGQVAVAAASKPDISDRVVGALPYLIPLFDGLRYGRFFLVQFPAVADVLAPLNPLIRLYYGFPFAGLIVFFAVYLGIIQNFRFSRYVRYNAMQAILLDVILILPGLLESVFRPPMGGPGLQIYITGYNTIFLYVLFCVAYGVGSCLVGQSARLPIVAEAADAQVR